jgi:hypothetical protein
MQVHPVLFQPLTGQLLMLLFLQAGDPTVALGLPFPSIL